MMDFGVILYFISFTLYFDLLSSGAFYVSVIYLLFVQKISSGFSSGLFSFSAFSFFFISFTRFFNIVRKYHTRSAFRSGFLFLFFFFFFLVTYDLKI